MLSLLFVDDLSVGSCTMLEVWFPVLVVCSVVVVGSSFVVVGSSFVVVGSSFVVVGSSVVVVGSSVEVSESQLFIWLGSWQLSVRLPFEEAGK